MDKASASGAGDSRFESWAGHFWHWFPINWKSKELGNCEYTKRNVIENTKHRTTQEHSLGWKWIGCSTTTRLTRAKSCGAELLCREINKNRPGTQQYCEKQHRIMGSHSEIDEHTVTKKHIKSQNPHWTIMRNQKEHNGTQDQTKNTTWSSLENVKKRKP